MKFISFKNFAIDQIQKSSKDLKLQNNGIRRRLKRMTKAVESVAEGEAYKKESEGQKDKPIDTSDKSKAVAEDVTETPSAEAATAHTVNSNKEQILMVDTTNLTHEDMSTEQTSQREIKVGTWKIIGSKAILTYFLGDSSNFHSSYPQIYRNCKVLKQYL